MCSPTALFLTAGGVGALGRYSQGQQAAALSNYNATLTEQEAVDAMNRGSIEEARYRREIAQVSGAQNATMGARNAQRSGTALDLLSDTALLGEQDALTIRQNTRREARGLRMQANNLRTQGRMARRNAMFSAGSTLLTSGAQAYGYWKKS